MAYRIQLEGVKDKYTRQAITCASRIITTAGGSDKGDLLLDAAAWARSAAPALKTGHAGAEARQLVNLALGADSGRYSQASFARSLATLFKLEIDKWTDRTAGQFEGLLQAAVTSVEDLVLASPRPPKRALPLIIKRLQILSKQLRHIAAPTEAKRVLECLGEKKGGKKKKR